eukprot:g17473.t1
MVLLQDVGGKIQQLTLLTSPLGSAPSASSSKTALGNELQLEELQIIREAEVAIETSYRGIVTPKNEGSWVTVKKGKGRKQSVQGSPVVVPLNNKYTVSEI